jgi:hypothetical protein
MPFRITGLAPDRYAHLFGLDDAALATHGARRVTADAVPGFPDRIALRDAAVGETLLLVNHVHHDVATPYRASHAIFVREGETARFDAVGEVPEVLRRRIVSLRGFDAAGMMRDADLAEGDAIAPALDRLFADPDVDYVHIHFAKRGCFAALARRA